MKQTLDITHPQLLLEWNYEKNDVDPSKLTFGCHNKIWWKCKLGHEWQQTINGRTNNKSGCPYCAGKIVSDINRFDLRLPYFIKWWDYNKNSFLPNEIAYSSHKKIYLICEKCNDSYQISALRCKKYTESICIKCRKIDLAKNKINQPDLDLINLCNVKIAIKAKNGKLKTRYWLPYQIKTIKALAKQRGKSWQLSNLETANLLLNKCTYCTRYFPQKMGIDRVDNSLGYLINNCVTCCWECNNAKRTKSVQEFKQWIIRVHNKSGNSNPIIYKKYNCASYAKRSIKRGIEFKLLPNEFNNLIGNPCHYCNQYSFGIDRLDSKIGYELNNCVPCCAECNKAKLTLTVNQFNKLIQLLYSNIDNF